MLRSCILVTIVEEPMEEIDSLRSLTLEAEKVIQLGRSLGSSFRESDQLSVQKIIDL